METHPSEPTAGRRRPPGWLFPVLFASLVIVLGVVALARGDGETNPTSPEGALRIYLQAIADRDWELAHSLLDPSDFDGCLPEDIARGSYETTFTVLHRETDLRDGRATVSVDIRFGTGGLLDPTWTNRVDFSLVRRDGLWYVGGDPWPYFRWACRE